MNEQKMRELCEEIRIDVCSYGFTCHKEGAWRIWQEAKRQDAERIAELEKQIAEYDGLMEDVQVFQSEIARLNHQHKNDEAANRVLSDECTRLRERTILECAALFSGGARNRELYINEVEETILALLRRSK